MSISNPTRPTRTSTTRTRPVSALATTLGAVALAVLAPASAEAHVGVRADTTAAGAYALLTVNVPHGCDGAATRRIAVQIPAGINAATPSVSPRWSIRKQQQKLADPVTTADGERLSTRVSEVIWTARTPLPEGYRDGLSLQLQLPEDAAGRQLAFPTIQTCTTGETAWTQVAEPGQDHDELKHPAPTLVVTAAEPEDDHAAHEPATVAEPSPASGPLARADLTAPPARGDGSATGVVGLVLGALGLLAGGTALLRSRPARPERR
jgi:uncharacterized protein YcnI